MDRILPLSVCFFMISFISEMPCYPLPKNDIISGKEFLSLFLENQENSRSLRRLYHDRSIDDGILPIEAMFSKEDLREESSRHYGYGRYRTQPRKYEGNRSRTTSTTTTTTTTTTTEEPIMEAETDPPTTITIPKAESTTASQPINEKKVIVITMNVSSSSEPSTPSDTEADENENPLNSNSYRSEFSIEEEDPTLNKDSVNGESTNVHSIVAPPVTTPPHHQPRSRTQRKQDAIAPYQTVIYHNNKDAKEQKSVSYSYVGETADNPKTWKDIDEEFLQNRNNTEKEPENIQKPAKIYSEPEKNYGEPAKIYSEPAKFYSEPAKIYSEPAKVYSEPAKFYGEPEKVYSVPAKIYSEPSKIYSEPSKIYSEPSKIYSEPSKIYSHPASYWNPPQTTVTPITSQYPTTKRIVFNELDKIPYDKLNAPVEDDPTEIHNAIGKFSPKHQHYSHDNKYEVTPDPNLKDTYEEQNYTPQGTESQNKALIPTPGPEDDAKVGYVVEGRNYRKYRVEEKTPDGFIVGEYGVVSHNDGNLRGVRYTADSNINPRLIYDALLKFLSL